MIQRSCETRFSRSDLVFGSDRLLKNGLYKNSGHSHDRKSFPGAGLRRFQVYTIGGFHTENPRVLPLRFLRADFGDTMQM